jgi:predicted DsbA family dithiol-disulfide isomerase
MNVEIWSDVVCPWCYIGKRRLEAALQRFEHAGEVTVTWRSFQLDQTAPRLLDADPARRLAVKYGMTHDQAVAAHDRLTRTAAEDGLELKLDATRWGNTFDAHRLLHLAADRGVQDAVKERLFRAYFTEGEPIGEPEALVRLVSGAGLDSDEARTVLESDAYAEEVRADEAMAAAMGVSGVPFFVFGRKYAVGGAQPAEVLLQVLQRAWADVPTLEPAPDAEDAAAACEGDACTVPTA